MTHNYMKRLELFWTKQRYPLGIYQSTVSHDDWCNIYKNKDCNCNPIITLKNVETGKEETIE